MTYGHYCSLFTSIFPTSWKLAEVIPLLTEGIMKSYQATVPCHSSRFFRRYAKKSSWLSLRPTSANTNYYPVTRTETVYFTPQRKQLILLLLTPSSKPVNAKEINILVLLDLSKAFDSVNHNILLRKISHPFSSGI